MCNPKFRKLVGKDARAENMESETDRISRSVLARLFVAFFVDYGWVQG